MASPKRAAKRLHRADRRVAHQAGKAKDTPAMQVVATIAEVGDQPPLIAISGATLLFGLLTRRRDVTEAGARMLASHLLATAIKTVVKRSVDRTRPHSVDSGHHYRMRRGNSSSHHHSSFPSGHTAGAVAVARAATRVWSDATPLAAGFAGTIATLQLPIGKHYATDVAAGALIGLASEALVNAGAQALARR